MVPDRVVKSPLPGHGMSDDTVVLPHRAKIFMAEDNAGDVVLMREAIKDVGFEVDLEVADDGAEAVARLLNNDLPLPDLITLNFNLPKTQGFEILAVIKQTERLKRIPVVMLTSSDTQNDRLRTSADAYFVKSGDWAELIEIVGHLRDLFCSSPLISLNKEGVALRDPFWNQRPRGRDRPCETSLRLDRR